MEINQYKGKDAVNQWHGLDWYFISFLITLSIGFDVVSAGATLLATGLALFGITGFVKNSMMEFETKIEKKLKRMEDIEQERKYE